VGLLGRVRHQPDIGEFRDAVHEDDIGRLDIAVNELFGVQIAQRLGQFHGQVHTLRHRKTPALVEFSREVARAIRVRLHRPPKLLAVAQLHHVIKKSSLTIPSQPEDGHQSVMRARCRGVMLYPAILPFEWGGVAE